jgi:curli production assembly/transport component CsgE
MLNKIILIPLVRMSLLFLIYTPVFSQLEQPAITNPDPDTVQFGEKQKQYQEEREKEIGMEITGLIMDETISKLGRDFYDLFFTKWNPSSDEDYILKIIEKPAPGTRTLVSVEINDNMVFQQFLQPKYDYIEALADYAVGVSNEYLQNYTQIQNQLDNEDLQGEGIF